MRLRYHELLGRMVVGADGKRVGRIEDLRAEARDEALCVTALLIGSSSFLDRLGLLWQRLYRQVPPHEVPWESVRHVGDEISLRIPSGEVGRAAQRLRQPKGEG